MAEPKELRVILKAEINQFLTGMNAARNAASAFGTAMPGIFGEATAALRALQAACGTSASAMGGVAAAGVGLAAGLGAAVLAFKGLELGVSTVGGAIKAGVKDAMEYEQAFAMVRKVVDPTTTNMKRLSDEIANLSLKLPVASTELAKIAAMGGQMGVAGDDLVKFTETIQRVAATSDIGGEQVAAMLARIAEVSDIPIGDFDKLASSLVATADSASASAAEVLRVTMQMQGMASAAGLTAPQMFALGTSMISVGVRAEAGGTAIGRFAVDITKAVATGGEKLNVFATLAGQSSQKFKETFEKNTFEAISKVIEGLSLLNQKDLFKFLDDMGIKNIRSTGTLLKLKEATELTAHSMEIAQAAYDKGTAVYDKSNTIYETTASKIQLLENAVTRTSQIFGETFLPAIQNFIAELAPMGQPLMDLAQDFKTAFGPEIAEQARFIGMAVRDLIADIIALTRALMDLGAPGFSAGLGANRDAIAWVDKTAKDRLAAINQARVANGQAPLPVPTGSRTSGAPGTGAPGTPGAGGTNRPPPIPPPSSKDAKAAAAQQVKNMAAAHADMRDSLNYEASLGKESMFEQVLGPLRAMDMAKSKDFGPLQVPGMTGNTPMSAEMFRLMSGQQSGAVKIGESGEVDEPGVRVGFGGKGNPKEKAGASWKSTMGAVASMASMGKMFGDDSTVGKIAGGIGIIGTAADNIKKINFGEGGFKMSGKGMSMQSKLQLGQAVGGGLDALGDMVGGGSPRSGASRALKGAGTGAKIGSVAGPYGMIVGAVIGAAVGYLHKPGWVKAAEEAGKKFGFSISDGLAKEIEANKKKFGTSLNSAMLMSLPKVMQESGKDARTFGSSAIELMQKVKDGSIPAAEGMKTIGETFSLVRDAAMKAGGPIDATLVGMIKAGRAAGLMTSEMKEHVSQMVDLSLQSMSGIFGKKTSEKTTSQKVVKDKDGNPVMGADGKPVTKTVETGATVEGGIKINTEADAKAGGDVFAATFWMAVKEKGLGEAGQALIEPWEAFKAQLENAGFEKMFQEGGPLSEINRMMSLSQDEAFKGASDGIQALKSNLEGVAGAGYLDKNTFESFGHMAMQSFEQAKGAATAGGASPAEAEKDAIMASMPLLIALKQAHETYGYQLTEEQQKLMGIAEANNMAFPTDPIREMTDAIKDLIAAITGVPRDISVNTSYTQTGTPPSAYGMPGSPAIPPGQAAEPPDMSAAVGFSGTVMKDSQIQVHRGEDLTIKPASNSGFSGGKGGMGAKGDVHVTFSPVISVTGVGDAAAVEKSVIDQLQNQGSALSTELKSYIDSSWGGQK